MAFEKCAWCGCSFNNNDGVSASGKKCSLLTPVFIGKYCSMRCYNQATGGGGVKSKEAEAQAKIAEQERYKAQAEADRAEAERKRQERLAFEAELKGITETEFSSDEASYENELKAFLRLYMQNSYLPEEKWFMPNWKALGENELKKKKAYEKRLQSEFQFMESDKPELYKKLFPTFNEEVNNFPIMKKIKMKRFLIIAGTIGGIILAIVIACIIGAIVG